MSMRELPAVTARAACVRSTVAFLTLMLLAGATAQAQPLLQQYEVEIEVQAGTADRQDRIVDAPVDLTTFLATIPGVLDPASLQVVETDIGGTITDFAVPFQFDPADGFDPTTNAAGTVVFLMGGTTTAGQTRYFQLAFDVVGACPTCPAPPVVANPVAVDSLSYQNQATFEVSTPRASYFYHRLGGGLASLIDNDAQDWISFQDIPGSGSAGEYRGIPNMVFDAGLASKRFFHPGFTNATTRLVASGPLKVTLRSEAGPPDNFWDVRWEFYPDHARLTVLSAGPGDSGPYWFLYEGTIGGSLDAGDVIVRSPGVETSAHDFGAAWESALGDPEWVYFRDTSAPRALFVSNDQPDTAPDSYRPMGAPDMTVFGFGRVLDTSPNALVGRMTGADRSFTMGFIEDHTVADAEIASASEPLTVIVEDLVPVEDQAPEISSFPDTTATVGRFYSHTVQATGIPAPDFFLAVSPAGMTIDPVSGTIGWLPNAESLEQVEVLATNSAGADTQAFWIDVQPAGSDSLRATEGLVALYDFQIGTGTVVPDISGVGAPLDLTITDPGATTWIPGGGLTLDSPTTVTSGGPATKLIDAALASNALTVEAWLVPASTSIVQGAPARIVTCSNTSSTRNFTLGQGVYLAGDDRYVMRLRTTETDDNGVPETATPIGSLTTKLTHVVFTRDALGNATIYLDGVLAQTGTVGGTMANWDASHPLILGDEVGGGRPWLGTYHMVALYERALTLPEILDNFTAGPTGIPVPSAPLILSQPLDSGVIDMPYTYDVLASGYPVPVFNLVDPPAGMAIGPLSGLVTWTPTATGDHPIVINAVNSEGIHTQTFTLSVYPDNPLQLVVWHGLEQRVGHLGQQQADFNVLGNIGPVADVTSLGYRLNGGPLEYLTIGPNTNRLEAEGDFNADIPVSQLQVGANTVTIEAIGTTGLLSSVDVTVTRETGGSQGLPVSIDWDSVTNPQDVGQFVDGKWGRVADGLKTLETGYDRIFLIGETDWQDYEVLVPVTIHTVYPNSAGLGLLMRFTGHVVGGYLNWPDEQPKWGYQPFGAIGWLRWVYGPGSNPEIQFHPGDNENTSNHGTTTVVVGNTYWMRMRCETQPDADDGDGVTIYSFKVWNNEETEPAAWSYQISQESEHALRQGGVGLLAHRVDATFGDVFIIAGPTSGVTTPDMGLARFVLHQNHPNPFNPATSISMDIPRETSARLGVYDLQGRRVRDLFTGVLARGVHTFEWDGRDDSGRGAATGIYLFRFESPTHSATRKMMLLK